MIDKTTGSKSMVLCYGGIVIESIIELPYQPKPGIAHIICEEHFRIGGGAANVAEWLASWSIPTLVIMSLWGVGGGMIIYLAGLQGIPTALYEAAKIDGAGTWHRFRHVTIPMITPVIFYNLVMGLIGSFQYFTEVYVATSGDGGPLRSTLVYNLYLYQNAFKYFEMGYASALAWFLLLLTLVATLLVFRSSPFWVFYEGEVRK